MFVEDRPHKGREVFRVNRRGIALAMILLGVLLLGVLLGIPFYWSSQQLPTDGFEIMYLGQLAGILLVAWGLGVMFAVESLVVNRSEGLLRWSRRMPFSRNTRTLRFDELRYIRFQARFDEGKVKGAKASLVTTSGKPIYLGCGNWGEVLSLARRISELTGVCVLGNN